MSKDNHLFSMIPRANVPRSSFNRSHGWKATGKASQLIPFYLDEVLPGDTFNCNATIFARLSSLIAPVMDNAYLDVFFFYVPTRLVWRHWKEFNGETIVDGVQTTEYSIPQMTATLPAKGTAQAANKLFGSLWDYFGLPCWSPSPDSITLSVSALPFRCCWKIWNDWFRDENINPCRNVSTGYAVSSVTTDVENQMLGDDSSHPFPINGARIIYRNKRHDYFTSALPWPQKGPSVGINVAASASGSGSISIPAQSASFSNPKATLVNVPRGTLYSPGNNLQLNATYTTSGENGGTYTGSVSSLNGTLSALAGSVSDLSVDLSDSTAITINALRQAFALQRFYEQDARGGTRYTEIIRSHFGVVSPDARLQRSEYLGGSSTPIDINAVVQTSSTDSTTPQANLAGFGVASSGRTGFTKSFTEHGYVIGFLNVRSELSYQQGINRMWSRKSRVEFYWPAFANLGEQAILNKELYAQGTSADDEVFGYQERYAEYRYHPSLITGALRSQDPTSLDVWHFAESFGSLPTFNEFWIAEPLDRTLKRCLAVQDEPQFIFDAFIKLKCARPMPVYGVPGLTRM